MVWPGLTLLFHKRAVLCAFVEQRRVLLGRGGLAREGRVAGTQVRATDFGRMSSKQGCPIRAQQSFNTCAALLGAACQTLQATLDRVTRSFLLLSLLLLLLVLQLTTLAHVTQHLMECTPIHAPIHGVESSLGRSASGVMPKWSVGSPGPAADIGRCTIPRAHCHVLVLPRAWDEGVIGV